jgi:hypothetical protein
MFTINIDFDGEIIVKKVSENEWVIKKADVAAGTETPFDDGRDDIVDNPVTPLG